MECQLWSHHLHMGCMCTVVGTKAKEQLLILVFLSRNEESESIGNQRRVAELSCRGLL